MTKSDHKVKSSNHQSNVNNKMKLDYNNNNKLNNQQQQNYRINHHDRLLLSSAFQSSSPSPTSSKLIKSDFISKSTESIFNNLDVNGTNNLNHAISSAKQHDFLLNKNEPVKYGELVVLGYNGYIPQTLMHTNQNSRLNSVLVNLKEFSQRRKSKFQLRKREKANGVKPTLQHTCVSANEVDEIMKKNHHTVTYTLSRNHTVVVQYMPDDKIDMFQIGRSSESSIDFIVLDTIPLSQVAANSKSNENQTQSTISRFSCRITVERDPPYKARIFAAGFDTSKHIFLGEKATKWRNEKGELDGVTTNGVLIMHPTKGFESDSKSNEWMEVSVCGAVFNLNDSRLTPRFSNESIESNILRDGTLIDLCGATLLWRSTESLTKTPTLDYIEMHIENLNRSKPQCPVGLKTLVFPSSSTAYLQMQMHQQILQQQFQSSKNYNLSTSSSSSEDRVPMVYLECGHVHGQHNWGVKNDNNDRECPLCRKVGPYVKLLVGLESSLYCDNDMSSFKPYAFRPCAHMASESTCKYWSKILVPQGTTQGLLAICPFCATPLSKDKPFVRLIFQEAIA